MLTVYASQKFGARDRRIAKLRFVNEVEPAVFDRLPRREEVVESVADLLHQPLRLLTRLVGSRAQNSCELLLISLDGMASAFQVRSALRSVHTPPNAVIHEDRLRQAHTNIGTLDEPERTTVCANDDESEVHLVDLTNQQDAIKRFQTVVDATADAVEDDRDGGVRISFRERLQHDDFRLTVRHQPRPLVNELSVHDFDLRLAERRAAIRSFLLLFHFSALSLMASDSKDCTRITGAIEMMIEHQIQAAH